MSSRELRLGSATATASCAGWTNGDARPLPLVAAVALVPLVGPVVGGGVTAALGDGGTGMGEPERESVSAPVGLAAPPPVIASSEM
jgi:hypothetical protein